MSRSNLELKVGIISVVAIVILVLGSIWGRDVKLSSSYRQLEFVFNHSGGLRPGDPVTVNGIKKGRVETVELTKRKVTVGITLDSDVNLYQDIEAHIVMLDLMGGTILEIKPGESAYSLSKTRMQSPIPGQSVSNLGLIIQDFQTLKIQADSLLSSMNSAVTNLNQILDQNTVINPLKESLANLNSSTRLMKKVLIANEGALDSLLKNSSESVSELKEILGNKRKTLEKSIDSFYRVAVKMDTVTTDLHEISQQLKNRKGSLAKLIYEDDIYENLQNSIAGVDSLTQSLKTNLGKYLQNTDINLLNLLKF
ncbi:MAG: MCE family protein [Calditrichaeota bacterium]|nr:MAG: MCE family protein [Calditrichota bacterium]